MRARSIVVALASVALLSAGILAAEKVKLDGVKCLLNPKGAAKEECCAEYNGGKVYFCCGNCLKKFNGAKEKFATAANHQLVATHQAKQVACPISGRDLNDAQQCKVGGVEVTFCCAGCKGKVAKAEGKEQKDLVFGAKAFAKGFKVAEKN